MFGLCFASLKAVLPLFYFFNKIFVDNEWRDYIMGNNELEHDKTEVAFKKLSELKRQKVKAQLILHLDGSGQVAKAEVKYDL